MYTKSLKEMKSGEVNYRFSPVDYDKLHATRNRIKRDPKYKDWNWQIVMGGGKVTVKRTS